MLFLRNLLIWCALTPTRKANPMAMKPAHVNDGRMKLKLPPQLIVEANDILSQFGMPVNEALVLFMYQVARTKALPEKVANVGNSAIQSTTRREVQLYLPEDVHLAAKDVLSSFGLTQSTAGAMMLKAVVDTRSLPFSLEL